MPKRSGYFLLNTDGGMVNDGKRRSGQALGRAAIAAVLYDSHNRIVGRHFKEIEPSTNAVAEYTALVKGLSYALEEGVTKIRVYMDSEFVVDQMNHRSKVKEEMRDLHNQAHDLLHRFDDYRVSWVPRERNQDADELVRSILYPNKTRKK